MLYIFPTDPYRFRPVHPFLIQSSLLLDKSFSSLPLGPGWNSSCVGEKRRRCRAIELFGSNDCWQRAHATYSWQLKAVAIAFVFDLVFSLTVSPYLSAPLVVTWLSLKTVKTKRTWSRRKTIIILNIDCSILLAWPFPFGISVVGWSSIRIISCLTRTIGQLICKWLQWVLYYLAWRES